MDKTGIDAELERMTDTIAHAMFDSYKALRRSQGKSVEYEAFESQPADLQRSNYDQARHISAKVAALGLGLAREGEVGAERVVEGFTNEQVEALARMEHDRFNEERLSAGWTLDRSASGSDPVRKVSPYLVPYDELEYDVQEYDRESARQLIPMLRAAGIVVVR